MPRAGKYKSIRGTRPVEIEHIRLQPATEGTEVFGSADLVLEGQAAVVQAVQWIWAALNPVADANDDIYDYMGILSMDENFDDNISVDFGTILDDEDTVCAVRHTRQNVITTSGQTIIDNSFVEWQHFEAFGGILVPETLRAGVVIADGGSVQAAVDIVIYYKRIANPSPAEVEFLYRRR